MQVSGGQNSEQTASMYDPFYNLALYVQKHFMSKENKFESMLSKKCIIRSRNIKGNKNAH